MRFDAPRLLAFAIAGGLAASPLAAAPARHIEISMCGTQDGKMHIPIPGKSSPTQDCPSACHAVMCRRGDAEEDQE